MLRRLLAVGRLMAPLALAVACASPTLPLPPPAAPTQEIGPDATHIRLVAPCGGAIADATIAIRNNNNPTDQTGVLVVADSCGKWDAPSVLARPGDLLEITQQFGFSISLPVVLTVR
jgi:hypothetical protein